MSRTVKIAVCTLTTDAGEATRALEIAKGLRDYCPEGIRAGIIFLSHGGKFDEVFRENGFEVYPAAPKLAGVGFVNDVAPTVSNMIGSAALARDLIEGELKALRETAPDVVLHGFWPTGGVAAKLYSKAAEVFYVPIPFSPVPYSTYLLKDLPDFITPLTYLPAGLRKKIMAAVPPKLKLKAPLLKQTNILTALQNIECEKKPVINNIFDMLSSDFTVVNDFPEFYRGCRLPENFAVTGPLFSLVGNGGEPDKKIFEHFGGGGLRIFCTLGSSGHREQLLEAIKALRAGENENWQAVVLCPKAVCPIEEARKAAGGNPNIYLTDAFVPALKVNAMADIVLSHGGQGTVQTAVASGTPIIGFAVQPEQQVNLDHIAEFGAAVRLPVRQWKAANIEKAIRTVSGTPSFHENMQKLKDAMSKLDGKKNAATAIWSFLEKKL